MIVLKALKEEEPEEALRGFEKVVKMETEKGEWFVFIYLAKVKFAFFLLK